MQRQVDLEELQAVVEEARQRYGRANGVGAIVMFDAQDIYSAALCAWKEGRGDGLTGMHAVLHCIKNRVGKSGFAKTIHDVIYGKNQFTSMSVPSDPEFNLDPYTGPSHWDRILFEESYRLSGIVLNTDDDDPTDGACYYRNAKTATSGWFQRNIADDLINHPMTVKINNHTFYK